MNEYWEVVFVDKDRCVGDDWDVQRAQCRIKCANKDEAMEIARQHTWPGRKFYWQPIVQKYVLQKELVVSETIRPEGNEITVMP